MKKSPSGKALKIILSLLAVGFASISAFAGFEFYRIIFGLFLGGIIVFVLEVSRLACIFSFIKSTGVAKLLALIVYLFVALLCAFGSISSLTARVFVHDFPRVREMQMQMHRIKREYSKLMQKKIDKLDEDIRYCNRMLARYPRSNYWKRRFEKISENRTNLIQERDAFLRYEPEDAGLWIRENAPKYGVKITNPSDKSIKLSAIDDSLQGLWGISKENAKKIMALVITVVVESSILLFAFLIAAREREDVNIHLLDEAEIRRFISKCADSFKKKGKLPPLRKVSPKFRPVKQLLQNLDRESLRRLLKDR